MTFLLQALAWITDPAHQGGPNGIWARLGEHLAYSAIGVLLACILAVPVGAWVGHTGRGRGLAVGLSSAARALPTLGLVTLLGIGLGIGLVGPMIAFVALAVPSILAGTYAGIGAAEPVGGLGAERPGPHPRVGQAAEFGQFEEVLVLEGVHDHDARVHGHQPAGARARPA